MADPYGFRPVRHLTGGQTFRARHYLADDNNPKPLFVGHAVVLVSGRVVEATAAGDAPILGVVKAIYGTNKNRPKINTLPSGRMQLDASTRAWVSVYDDPDIVFSITADMSVEPDDLGQVGTIVATGSGNPTTGQSRMEMDTSTFAAETTANGDTLCFKLVGGLSGLEVNQVPVSSNQVEVIINNHVYRKRG